jgi:hypothetical protein
MKQPIVVSNFSQLSYALKAGHPPVEVKEKPKQAHSGSWSVYYGKLLVEANIKYYGQCVNKVNECKLNGRDYPKPELLKIKPYENGNK